MGVSHQDWTKDIKAQDTLAVMLPAIIITLFIQYIIKLEVHTVLQALILTTIYFTSMFIVWLIEYKELKKIVMERSSLTKQKKEDTPSTN